METSVIVITGGSGTIGLALVEGLARAGHRVILLDRRAPRGRAHARRLSAAGLNVQTVCGDVLNEADMERTANEVMDAAGRIDVLINCAGGNQRGATIMPDESFFATDSDAFRRVSELNFMGSVIPSRYYGRHMATAGKGSIINVSSMAALTPITRVAGYGASKAAITNFTRWLAVELAHKHGSGLRVNAIAPGFLVAEQNRALLLHPDGSLTDRGQRIIDHTPLGRFGRPEELLSTIEWLIDERSAFVTGIVVPIDGGFSAYCGV